MAYVPQIDFNQLDFSPLLDEIVTSLCETLDINISSLVSWICTHVKRTDIQKVFGTGRYSYGSNEFVRDVLCFIRQHSKTALKSASSAVETVFHLFMLLPFPYTYLRR